MFPVWLVTITRLSKNGDLGMSFKKKHGRNKRNLIMESIAPCEGGQDKKVINELNILLLNIYLYSITSRF